MDEIFRNTFVCIYKEDEFALVEISIKLISDGLVNDKLPLLQAIAREQNGDVVQWRINVTEQQWVDIRVHFELTNAYSCEFEAPSSTKKHASATVSRPAIGTTSCGWK